VGVSTWRRSIHATSTRFYHPDDDSLPFSWIVDERIAVGNLPTPLTLPLLTEAGITHVVNCRARVQTWLSQDLAVEREIFGRDHVAFAPMFDFGHPQRSRLWAPAARFVVDALQADPDNRVFIHCQQGRRRSVLVAYAVLRLLGRAPEQATKVITDGRAEAVVVPAYARSVERWLERNSPR